MARQDAPAFSRPRGSTGFGKNDVPAKTLVPRDIHTDATRAVRADGYTNLSEFLRDVVIAKARGFSSLRSVAERRLRSVSGIVPEKDRR